MLFSFLFKLLRARWLLVALCGCAIECGDRCGERDRLLDVRVDWPWLNIFSVLFTFTLGKKDNEVLMGSCGVGCMCGNGELRILVPLLSLLLLPLLPIFITSLVHSMTLFYVNAFTTAMAAALHDDGLRRCVAFTPVRVGEGEFFLLLSPFF